MKKHLLLIVAAFCYGCLPEKIPSLTPPDTVMFEFKWQAFDAQQAYDSRNPEPIYGWTRRYLDFDQKRLNEIQLICYPGGIAFELERYVDSNGSWFKDRSGWRYGQEILHAPAATYVNYLQSLSSSSLYLLDNPEITAENEDLSIKKVGDNVEVSARGYQTTFSNIKQLNDLRYAGSAQILREGRSKATMRTTLHASRNIPTLDTPAWVKLYVSSPPEPMLIEDLGNGVVLIKNVGDGRNVLAVLDDNGWWIFGAPLNSDLSLATHTLLSEKTGQSSIASVFVSHAHGDHIGGIAYYLEQGASLRVSDSVYEQLLDVNIPFLKEASIQTFSGVFEIQLGNTAIELHEVSNTHANGLSFVWLPQEKLLYQGDFLSVPNDETITPAMTITHELDAYLKRREIEFTRMIGHHNHDMITPAIYQSILNAPEQRKNNYPSCSDLAL